MDYKVKDKVKIGSGRIGTITKVVYETVNGRVKTDKVYCYEMEIDGVGGYVVYPDEIEQ